MLKQAAIGIRAHSGWGALVAISGKASLIQVLDRTRIAVTDRAIAGANQPYHFAQEMDLPAAGKYLAECAAASEQIASAALQPVIDRIRSRGYRIAGCAILLASGRPLPELPKILASHSLIHTAEGEFFRRVFWKAFDDFGIPVTGVRERDLEGRIDIALRQEIAGMGRVIGPPWTADQKTASMAAMLALRPS